LDSREVLPTRMVLDGSYRILRVVGSGGFGITYEAEDISLGTMVAVKEYYPHDFGERAGTMNVRPRSDRHKKTFDWGKANFLEEARTLARFEHISIVRVTRVFEANSTAYMVMRFERGASFEHWLRSLGRLPTQAELDRIVAPLLDALEMLHAADFLHRDIAPDNIIVRADGTPVLLDFGAARRAVAEMSQALTGIVKAGYSPHEQYASDGRLQGPWSDLYALGGTLYRAIANKHPEEATLRFDEDRMLPAAQIGRGQYRPGFLAAIDTCLKVRHSERPRSVAEVRPMLLDEDRRLSLNRFVEALKPSTGPARSAPSDAPVGGGGLGRWPIIVAAAIAILGGAYGGYWYTQQPTDPAEIAAQARRDAEARRLADLEAKTRQKEAEEKRQGELKRQAELEAQRQKEAEAKRQADIEAQKRQKEAEDKRQADLKRQAELEAQRQKEAEARRQAELDAQRKKEAEVKRQAELEAQKRDKEAQERQALLDLEKRRKTETEEERALIAKGTFRDCGICPEMVVVPAGELTMGSSKGEIDAGTAAGNEGPQRRIVLRQPLAIGRTEVTRDQFEAFVRATGHKVGDKCWTLEGNEPRERDGRSFRNPGYPQTGTHPAVCVSFEDSKAYAEWLSKTTAKPYRLLSEAQWEYAARAGATGRFAGAGSEADLCAAGNGADQAASAARLPAAWEFLRCNDGYAHTAPVASFKPNAFGLYDMMGNTWEWVEDCYTDNLADVPADGQGRTSGDCSQRAVRGGAWSAAARMLRVAVRAKAPAGSRFDDVGFRVARQLTATP